MKTAEIGPSLLAACARVPAGRSRHGRRSPLAALLTLATAAMVSGARSGYASVPWGRLHPPEVQRALGFTRGRVPAMPTLHAVFKRLDVGTFAILLTEWATQALGPGDHQLVLDGKALRGLHGQEWPGVRLVALDAPQAGLGDRRQRGVRTQADQAEAEDARDQAKQEAELSVAPRLGGCGRRGRPWPGGW